MWPLSNSKGEKLSAGRVQSPAVRLVVEREKKIKAISSTTHYGAELTFENVDNITDGWKAIFLVKPWLPDPADGQEYLLDKSLAEKAAADAGRAGLRGIRKPRRSSGSLLQKHQILI